MLERSRELLFAVWAIVFITIVYFLMLTLTREIPAASSLYGHSMGILGIVLMLMTETLYTLRKRWKNAHWGKMARWLEFHIFTGIVGPYLVLLHTSWKFNGLAGATMLMTVIIVFSGFIGRYIYTRVPRTADGIEDPGLVGQMQAAALANARRLMALWHTVHIPIGMALFTAAFVHMLGALYYATFLK